MKSSCNIRVEGDGLVHLSGELTFESTPAVYQELESRFQSGDQALTVDLGGIERTDSSGLALLLEWQAMANRQKWELHVLNAPDSLLQLAKLSEADKLLSLSTQSD